MSAPYLSPNGDIVLHHCDARELLPTLNPVACVLTDPPYGTRELSGGYGRRLNRCKAGKWVGTIANDSDLALLAECFPTLCSLVPSGWMAVFFSARKTVEFVDATRGAEWFGKIIWDKAQPGLGYHIRYCHEDIAVFRMGEPERPKEPIMSILRGGTIADVHPHEKPVDILARLVRWMTKPGETVLDPFSGSGTTAAACVRTGRRFVGCELDETFFNLAVERIQRELDRPMMTGMLDDAVMQADMVL